MPQANDPVPATAHSQPCPCGSNRSLAVCCLPCITGAQPAQTAEQLMRSRYTAHVFVQVDYLWQTWSAEQRQRSSPEQIYAWAASCEWLGLQIISTSAGQSTDAEGTVDFVALYQHDGNFLQHHEIARFRQSLGRWFYVDHVGH
jgi:SEC-C motif-containing protein